MDVSTWGLEGKRALVVGASRGIGAAISVALAEAGADVAVAARSVGALRQTGEAIRALGRRAYAVRLDLGDEAAVNEGVTSAYGALGGLDIVVNSGGISPVFKRIEKMTVEEWDTIFSTNARGSFLLARAVGEYLTRQGQGVLIFVSSIHEEVGMERLSAYCASKGALRMLARVLALEWAQYNVRVNCLSPSYVETDLTAGMRANPHLRERLEQATPLGRMASTEEIAASAVYLASDAARYVTGASLYIDGGWTAR